MPETPKRRRTTTARRRSARRARTIRRRTRKATRALSRAQRHRKDLRAFAGQLIRLQEQERSRISRELHDAVNQQVGFLAFELDLLTHQLPSSKTKVRAKLAALKDQAAVLAQDIRRLAHGLHPAILNHHGLESALRDYIGQIEKTCEPEIRFRARSVPKTLSADSALCLYRSAQECVGNALRYAEASLIRVELRGFRNSVRLTVKDDGRGFSMAILRKPARGLGFVSLQERIRLVRGQCWVRSKPGSGTQVTVLVPARGSTPSERAERSAAASSRRASARRPRRPGAAAR